jgi:renalase
MGTLPKNVLTRNGMTTSVAVVGAGIAGLTCARTLTDHGFEVTVFDKARNVGGRTSTRRVEPDFAFDHGAQYFTARNPHFVQFVEALKSRGCVAEWGGRIVKLENGVATETSPQSRFVGVPGMSALAACLAADLAICREVHIERIVHTSDAWELADATGKKLGPFQFLVLSLPAPQSAVLLGSHPFAAEADGVAMTPCWTLLVAFEDRFEVPWDGAFVSKSSLSWLARNSSKPGRPRGADCWVLHASPEWSETHLEESPDSVGPQFLQAFEAAVGCVLPRVVYQSAHRWRYSLGSDPAVRVALFDAAAGLGVCGDWLSDGRVEGAFLSGTAAAEAVLLQLGITNFPCDI